MRTKIYFSWIKDYTQHTLCLRYADNGRIVTGSKRMISKTSQADCNAKKAELRSTFAHFTIIAKEG